MKWWERWACSIRSLFDRLARRLPTGVTGGIAILAGISFWLYSKISSALSAACTDLAARPIRIEVTFDPQRFAALLRASGDAACRAQLAPPFLSWDLAFAASYAVTLTALYIWVERWRRFEPDGTETPERLPRLTHLFVLAPLIAGALDAFIENVLLHRAAIAVPAGSAPAAIPDITLPVVLGSAASAVKWILIVIVAFGILAELLRGPRGVVITRTRYSILAVAIGALPLLAVAQGQDILQRLVEGTHPAVRIVTSVLGLLFGGAAVWYCGRSIMELRFEGDERWKPNADARSPETARDRRERHWYAFFAEKVPRVFGVALLALAGAAFARAGLSISSFAIANGGGLILALVLRRWKHVLRAIGLAVTGLIPAGRAMDVFSESAGMAIVANLCGVIPVAICAWSAARRTPPRQTELEACYLQVGAWLCAVLAWTLYLFVAFRRPRREARAVLAAGKPNGAAAVLDQTDLTPVSQRDETYMMRDANKLDTGLKVRVAIAAIASATLLVLFTVAPVSAGRSLGPLLLLVTAVANAVFVGSVTVWVYGRYRVRLVTIGLLLALLFSAWNDNHVVRPIDASTWSRADPRPTIDAHLDQWLRARSPAPGNTSVPVILVAAAGGGLRAAYWTATALAAAQDRNPEFVRHVFAISGVSGGSLGAAVFTALAHDAPDSSAARRLECAQDVEHTRGATRSPGAYSSCVRSLLGDDYLSPVLAKLVAPDLAQRFFPIAIDALDRSSALEGSWEASYATRVGAPTFANGLWKLTSDSASRLRLPLLLLNSTHVESGRRYIAMPVRTDLGPGAHNGSTDRTFADAVDVLGLLGGDLRFATAVHNSARFTFVSPAGRLDRGDGVEYGHVVDGGYFENSGLATLREIHHLLSSRSGVRSVVLYLCNDPIGCANDMASDTASLAVPASTTNELMAPVRAVLNARDARGAMARAELRNEADVFLQMNVCDNLFLHEVGGVAASGDSATTSSDSARVHRSRERVVSPPLGWLLSRLARDWMDASLLAGRRTSARRSLCVANNAAVLARLDSLLR
ncbi:MAG TPA: hypothetical protein VH539_19025 [Gemmatimonadaceae bacterium]